MQKRSSVANNFAPLSLGFMDIISCNRSLQPMPPTIGTSWELACTIARSVFAS
jgi:hypothetical protein